jgi:two-component sensor histidine kinase
MTGWHYNPRGRPATSRSSTWARLIGTFAIPWLVVVVFSFLYYPSMQKSSIRQAARQHIQTLSEMVAFAVGAGLSESNFELVQTAFDWSKKDTSVTYLGILDESDSLIVEFNPRRMKIRAAEIAHGNQVIESAELLTSVSEVQSKGQVYGKIVLLYSMDKVELSIAHQQVVSILVSIIVFAIGFWGTLLLARQSSELESARAGAENQALLLARQADDLSRSNTNLERTNRDLLAVQLEVQRAHDEMEQRVIDRTARLASANEAIKTSLHEKEVMLKEIHHRVKNNMQVISSLLNLQRDYLRDDHDRMLFDESQSRVRSMSLIHEKLYQSKSLARIDFGEYVGDLAKAIFRTHRKPGVALDVDAPGIYFGVDTAIPCGLIVNEVISNSMKYAFPDGRTGTVFAHARRIDPQHCSLRVGDDGIGLPPAVDIENTKTLGLQLVYMLSQQLGATIALHRDNGTVFELTIPLPTAQQETEETPV